MVEVHRMDFVIIFNILVCVMAAVLKLAISVNSNDSAQFNPNVPPGFIAGSSVQSENSFSNISSNATSAANKAPTTISHPTTLIISSSSTILENINVSSLKNSTEGQTTVKPMSIQSTSIKSTPTKIKQTTVQAKSLSSGTTASFSSSSYSLNSSFSTMPISTSALQGANVTSLQSISVAIPQSSVSTDRPTNNDSESNYTTQSSFVSIMHENTSVTPLKTTVTTVNKTTTNSFDNISPWNIPRSTYEPRRNGSHTTQTETNRKDDYDKGDTFWPVAMALTIGVPTIIVFAVTITVLYRRRMNKPRGLLGMYGTDYQSM